MTVREAAARLCLHPSTVYDLARAGAIPHRRVGPKKGKIVFDPADVEAYWEACKSLGGETPRGELKHIRL